VTYGDQIWDEMGKDLSVWNKHAANILAEAALAFFPVNVFHWCKYKFVVIQQGTNMTMISAFHS
jgi:hypothetical protein